MRLPYAIVGCFVSCSAYALALNTKRGRYVTLYHTWASVVAGVALVLGWAGTQRCHSARTDVLFFIAGGTPMIIRSLLLSQRYTDELTDYHRGA